jgi:D-glycerate 3-kinase
LPPFHENQTGEELTGSSTDYPSYELFTTTLREGVFKPRHHPEYDQSWKMKQLRLVIDRDRKVTEVIVI